MRCLLELSLALLMLVSFAVSVQAQRSKSKAVMIPPDIFLPAVVAQPDCPLRIEKAFMGKRLEGTEEVFFQARNTGTKPVVSFQVYVIGSNGNGVTDMYPYERGQRSVAPGAVAPPGLKEDSVEFVPLTRDLRKQLRLEGRMRAIAFFMVLRVELDDGTTYDATALLGSLVEHLRMFEDKYEKSRLPL